MTLMNVPSVERVEQRRDDGDQRQREQHEDDPAEGEQQRGAAELEEVAALRLVVGDVDRRHQAARAARRAPQREQDRHDQAEAQRAAARLGQRRRSGRGSAAGPSCGSAASTPSACWAMVAGSATRPKRLIPAISAGKIGEERGVGDAARQDPDVVRRRLLERALWSPAASRSRGICVGSAACSPGRARRAVPEAAVLRPGPFPVERRGPRRSCCRRAGFDVGACRRADRAAGRPAGGTGRRWRASWPPCPCACAAPPGRRRPTRAPSLRAARASAVGRRDRRGRVWTRTSGGGTRAPPAVVVAEGARTCGPALGG